MVQAVCVHLLLHEQWSQNTRRMVWCQPMSEQESRCGGYIKIHRSIWTCSHVDCEAFSQREALIWLISNAAYRDHVTRYRSHKVSLRRGQFATTVRDLADTWKWHRSRVERFLARLKIETVIETHSETHFSVITICNYDIYQGCEDNPETLTEEPARHARDTRETMTEEGKESKKQNTPPYTPPSPASIVGVGFDPDPPIDLPGAKPADRSGASSFPCAEAAPGIRTNGSSEGLPDHPAPSLFDNGGIKPAKSHRADADFEDWWKGYPIKQGKEPARKAYRKVIDERRATPEQLKDSLSRYVAWCSKGDIKFKYAQGWLNDNRWTDEFRKEAPKVSKARAGTDFL